MSPEFIAISMFVVLVIFLFMGHPWPSSWEESGFSSAYDPGMEFLRNGHDPDLRDHGQLRPGRHHSFHSHGQLSHHVRGGR